MAEQWLSIVEYARTFGISDMTIRRRIRTGRIQAYLRDGKYFIPVDKDPLTGEPVKQGVKAKPEVAPQSAMKSHPAADRTIPTVRHQASHIDTQMPAERPRSNTHQVQERSLGNFPTQASHQTERDQRTQQRQDARVQSYAPQYGQIPGRIVSMVASESEVSVESHALLEYCNSSLATVKDIERHIEGRYMAKLETASEQIKNRDAEVARLSQQIEDLQLLVQILERKRQ